MPGTIARAPKSWPIDRLQAAAPPLLSTRDEAGEAAGIGRRRRRPAPAPFHPASAAAPAIGGGAT